MQLTQDDRRDALTATYWLQVGILALLYYLGGSFGKLIAIPPGNITALWPPSGLALGALILLGYRYWPAIWLGSFVFNLVFFLQGGREPTVAYLVACAAVAAGAAMQALLGAYLAKEHLGYSNTVWKSDSFFRTILLGALFCSTINATFGTTSFMVIGEVLSSQYISTWLTWWFGDATGVLVITSFLLVISHQVQDHNFLKMRRRADRLWHIFSTLTILLVISLTLAGYTVMRREMGAEALQTATLLLLFGLILTLSLIMLLFGLNATRSKAFHIADEAGRSLADKTRELEHSDRELEIFIKALSSDLQTPLRAIARFSKSLKTTAAPKLSEEEQESLRQVRENAEKIELLVDELLGLSKISRQELKREETNLSVIGNNVLAGFLQQEPGRTVRFSVEEKVIVTADRQLMRVVMECLLGNAWKFTQYTPNAFIEFGQVHQGKQLVYFVKDNGPGFDMKEEHKLFIPFQRLTQDRDFPGSGTGLAVVQRIIQRHNGRIWAKAEKGKGATFYFTLGDQ